MRRKQKLLQGLVVILLLCSLTLPASLPVQAVGSRIQPQILKIAEENPDRTVRVIIQKADHSDRVEKMVERLGAVDVEVRQAGNFAEARCRKPGG